MRHVPVLLQESLKLLEPRLGEAFVDATLGDGGHAVEIIKRIGENGKFLGIDLDARAAETAKFVLQNSKLKIKELIIEKENFKNLKKIIQKYNFGAIDGILFDLGLRSEQIEESARGFSFLRDEPLDMRFGELSDNLTAAEILNSYTKDELERVFRKLGEERFSKDIASEIVAARKKKKFITTFQLVEVVLSIYRQKLGSKKQIPWIHGGIHPATRIFQALRIEANKELEVLEKALPQAVELLGQGGRIAVISFHSLEDRIVKRFFRSRKDLKILTKKPITSSLAEIQANPRSRSAKLRAAIKVT